MKSMNKKESQEIHALRRLQERFNIELKIYEYRSIVNSIKNLGNDKKKNYEVEFLGKQSNTRSLYKIYYNDIELYAVYDKSRGSICTFLLGEYLSEIIKE